ncbi:MAG: glycosyltransferase family 4 protein [Minisyncoccia bacterium]|jgi:glycosyltransferase involved in cell wall biosynthesis
MKILYVITKSNWGGAQRHVFDLATAMKKSGHEVKAALGGEGALKTRLEAAGVFTYPIDSLRRDVSVFEDAGSFRELFSVIRRQRPDILHLHSPKAAGLGAVAGRILGVKKIISTVHGWTFNEGRPFHERALIALFSWLTAILCHKVIVVSKRDYEQGVRFPGLRERLVLIRPGIGPAALVSVDGAKRFMARQIGLDPAAFNGKKNVIGTIAEPHPNKGLSYLVEAVALVVRQHPDTISVIIGDGQEKARLHMLIKEKKLERQTFLPGYVPNASEYMKAFTMFAMSSVKEGLPYVLLEAGAASLPVVATTVGGIPEVVDDMESGILVQPKNACELSHAISFMIEHPEERRGYGRALREKVLKDFSLERMIKETEEVYMSE